MKKPINKLICLVNRRVFHLDGDNTIYIYFIYIYIFFTNLKYNETTNILTVQKQELHLIQA